MTDEEEVPGHERGIKASGLEGGEAAS